MLVRRLLVGVWVVLRRRGHVAVLHMPEFLHSQSTTNDDPLAHALDVCKT